MTGIVRSASDVLRMQKEAQRQADTSHVPEFWMGALEALTWLLSDGEAPVLDAHWQMRDDSGETGEANARDGSGTRRRR